MVGEPFEHKRLHHWHLGLFGAIMSFVIALVKLGWDNAISANGWTIAGCSFALWGLDDALWHSFGWKWLPFHLLHEGLNNWGWYSEIDRWVKKRFK